MNPVYLLAGGRGESRKGPDLLLQEVFSRTGLKEPSVAYLGAASEDDRDFHNWLSARFRAAGSGAVRLAPTASARADLDKARAILSESDLVFFSGGDVEVGMRILRERGLLPFLRRLHRVGRPFFGLSAGSIMLARGWVRWADPANDATAERFDCLGLVPILCDTHAETENWEELKALLRLCRHPGTVGYGIPSGGALRIMPNGGVSALGKPAFRFRAQAGGIVSLLPLPPEPASGRCGLPGGNRGPISTVNK